MSGSITLSPAVAQFKQKHPRYFTASICAIVALPLLWMLNRSTDLYSTMPDRFAYYAVSSSSNSELASLQATNAKGQDLLPAIGPRNMAAFVDRAEELWRHNKQKRAQFIQEHNGVRNMRMFTEKSEGGWGQLYTIWDLYLPAFPCPWEVERVGRLVDGGKYTCGLPRIEAVRAEKCVVYSFGVAQESSWEAELLTRTDCEIFAYDFSVDKPGPQIFALSEERQSRFHFHRFGVGPRDEEQYGYPFYTLRSLMKQNGHDWIDILKIDIEGSEFTVIPDIISEFGKNHLPFDQLLLEIHVNETPEREYNLELFDNWWNTMEAAGLRAFVGELNYPAIHFTPYPQAIEIGYLNYGNRKQSRGHMLVD